jgi:choice-of-anchor B domain-containing protein
MWKNKFFTLLPLLLSSLFTLGQGDSLDCSKLGRLGYSQSLSDVWGYVDTAANKEYALVGVRNGLSVVDVTNPSNPFQVRFFGGASSIWRDMKTYQNYVYTIHDNYAGNSDGIFILDMNTINNTFPTTYNRYPVINHNGAARSFDKGHNLYIDENGILYVFGSNIGNGGALLFDLKPDPVNPSFIGIYDDYYLHDGVARGDTMWGAAVLQGFFVPVDVSNPGAMVNMATRSTPSNFTHNIWFSDDNQRVFTTDERSAAYIAEYDVSDFNNITELDRIRTSFGTTVIPHNTHFYNDFLVTSYYTSGLQIVDVSQPGIMVETGYYDTSNDTGDGFNGAWGAYPYLPSGNILVTDIQSGLWVISSDYSRGCYLNAHVVDSTSGNNLINASVELLNAAINGNTNLFGNMLDGQAEAGSFQAVVSKPGYQTDTFNVNLSRGVTVNRRFALLPNNFSIAENPLRSTELFPNPVKDALVQIINLPAAARGTIYQLLNLQGVVQKKGRLDNSGGSALIDLKEVPSGTYLLKLNCDEFERCIRLVIK